MKKIITLDGNKTIELTEVEGEFDWENIETPDGGKLLTSKVMAEIYQDGWLVWYVGLFNSEVDAYHAAIDYNERS